MSCITTSLAHLIPFFLISGCRYLFHFYEYLFSIPHMNFIILNTIIIVVIFLSRRDTTRNNSSAPTCQEAATEAETEKAYNEELYIVVDSEHPVRKMQFDGSNAEMESAGKMIRHCRFRRTQSEKLKREHRLALGTILRPPETVFVSGDDERATTSVDQVDSHADAFIAKQKRFWLAEKMAEKGQESYDC